MSSTSVPEPPPTDLSPELSIVVPILNEAECLASLHERLSGTLAALSRPYEIIAVDDGSTDSSPMVLRRLAEADPCLRVVRLRRNFGKTAALAAGFARARGGIVVTIDADLQQDPADIPKLLDKLEEGFDVVSGWRMDRRDPLWSRRLPSRLANRLISRTTGVALHDYGCSLKAYRAEVLRDLPLYGELHRFLPAIASWQGIDLAEIPVNHSVRLAGSSKYGLERTLPVLVDLVTVRFLLSYRNRPMQIFGLLGLAMMSAGVGISTYLAVLKIVAGARIGNRPLLLLGVMLVVVGMQVLAVGLIGELVIRLHGGFSRAAPYVVREELNAPPGAAPGETEA